MPSVVARSVAGSTRVVREIRAARPLLRELRAPIPAREPWLTATLHDAAARRPRSRPVAVVVAPALVGRPAGLALLSLRRRSGTTEVVLLGDGSPRPEGGPAARLPARTPVVAAALADGVSGLLDGLRGPWTLRLSGLPLGDPVLAALAERLPTAALRTERTRRLADDLDRCGSTVLRSRDPAELERWLPALLAAEPDPGRRRFVRAVARVHAAIGQLELAVVPSGGYPRAALLTLVDGADRWPWWAPPGGQGVDGGMGSPVATLVARGGSRPRPVLVSPRTGAR